MAIVKACITRSKNEYNSRHASLKRGLWKTKSNLMSWRKAWTHSKTKRENSWQRIRKTHHNPKRKRGRATESLKVLGVETNRRKTKGIVEGDWKAKTWEETERRGRKMNWTRTLKKKRRRTRTPDLNWVRNLRIRGMTTHVQKLIQSCQRTIRPCLKMRFILASLKTECWIWCKKDWRCRNLRMTSSLGSYSLKKQFSVRRKIKCWDSCGYLT